MPGYTYFMYNYISTKIYSQISRWCVEKLPRIRRLYFLVKTRQKNKHSTRHHQKGAYISQFMYTSGRWLGSGKEPAVLYKQRASLRPLISTTDLFRIPLLWISYP